MSSDDLFALIDAAKDEAALRQTREALERDMNNVLLEARENGAAEAPSSWWKGTPSIDESYAVGETTILDGVEWVSCIPANRCTPGRCAIGWERADQGK
ncbi:hypothetical protein QDX25_07210 [Auritidibacter ignavus]|uniref:hypothetical protein n=1 Tax=Auritidibacter ignavus TaxID=678932 RepID=UPI002448B65B|nr:hypothetical protein [Auritidibacter ignavus]WGH80596.1 hypothetical protein QDX25_07210 [Auritidibacter ignavus]